MNISHNKGQSFLEYTTVIIVVALGIILMGPYVLRSVNAQFKLWEDSVNDALNDRIEEASPEEIPLGP